MRNLLTPVWDMGTHSRQPFQGGEALACLLSPDRSPGHALAVIDDLSLLIQIRHAFLGERCPDNVTSQFLTQSHSPNSTTLFWWQEGQKWRRLQEKASKYSWPQSLHLRSGRGQASHGQSRCGDRRNRDTDRSPARYKAARIHTAVRTVHHITAQRFQNNPLRSGNNPNLAGGVAGKQPRAMTCLPRLSGRIIHPEAVRHNRAIVLLSRGNRNCVYFDLKESSFTELHGLFSTWWNWYTKKKVIN